MLVEIGGTVGDIESLPFLEAIRQFRQDVGRDNTLYIHLTLVPFIGAAGELKTKPTQHSVRDLRSIGIQPDILLCRTDRFLDPDIKRKIALFCDVDEEAVITAKDVVDDLRSAAGARRRRASTASCSSTCTCRRPSGACRRGRISSAASRTRSTRSRSTSSASMSATRIRTRASTRRSITAGFPHRLKVNIKWIEAEALEEPDGAALLDGADGILVPGGFGNRGTRGMMKAAQIARERGIPYFGICYGFQWATVEYARNVAGLADADSTECNPDTPTKVIYKLRDLLGVDDLGGTMRLGSYACELTPGSLGTAASTAPTLIHERHRHRYEFNCLYEQTLHRARPADFRPIARRQVRRDRRTARPSVVPRGAVPSRVQVEADAAASALRRVRRRRVSAQERARRRPREREALVASRCARSTSTRRPLTRPCQTA